MAETVVIEAVHYGQRIAVLESGQTVPFVTLIGSDGEDTDDISDAIAATAALPDGRWVLIDFDDFEDRPLH